MRPIIGIICALLAIGCVLVAASAAFVFVIRFSLCMAAAALFFSYWRLLSSRNK